jgi:uncharacterized membrane protein YbhN (UPF0104 family)
VASPLPVATAHVVCALLFLADTLARALRLQVLVRAFGGSLGLWPAIAANFVEEAAAGLTPMRIGSTAGRAVMLARHDVSVRVTVLAGVVESSLMVPLVAVASAVVGFLFAPDWWATVGPRLERSARHLTPWLLLGGLLGVVAWVVARRVVPHHHHSLKRTLVHSAQEVRRLPPRVLATLAVLNVVSLVARVAILPVVAYTVPRARPLGQVVLGSFVMLFGQLFLPTPSGAGAVEVGMLAGGGGVTGHAASWVLLAWRFYTTFLPVGAGLLIGAFAGVFHLRSRRRGEAVEGNALADVAPAVDGKTAITPLSLAESPHGTELPRDIESPRSGPPSRSDR